MRIHVASTIQERKRGAAADAVRVRLITFLQTSDRADWTVKELAEALTVTANGLYYHLRVLVEAQLVAVTGHKVVDRLAERTYGPVAPEEMVTDWSMGRPQELVPYFDGLLDLAKADVQAALFDAARNYEDTGEEAWWRVGVQKRTWTLPPDSVKEFNKRIFALLAEFQTRSNDASGEPDTVRLNVSCAYGQHSR